MQENNKNNYYEAFKIAKSTLRACYGEKGIFAGLHQFKDYWARDSFFASFGALALKDYLIIKKNLILFLKYIKKDGQLPLRIGKTSLEILYSYIFNKYDGKRKPIYYIDKGKKKPIDQNSLFIISFYNYIMKIKDLYFLKNNIKKIDEIIEWLFYQDLDNDYLIEEDEYCNWADSVKKKGKVLYSNVCFCYSLKCVSELYELLKDKTKKNYYLEKYNKTKKRINEVFWQGDYYLDWVYQNKNDLKTYDYFSADGNYLAILWDISDEEKSKKILDYSHILDPCKASFPDYNNNLISTQLKLIGLNKYHSLHWLWIGCFKAMAYKKLKMNNEAKEILNYIADLILKYNGIYEIYDYDKNKNQKDKLVKKLIPFNGLYRSEMPFAWSAGIYIYALKYIHKINE